MFNICAITNTAASKYGHICKNFRCNILIKCRNNTMRIIQIIIKELNNTILKYDISKWNPIISFWSYYISKNRILIKCSFKKLFRSTECFIDYFFIININTKSNITKLFLFWKKPFKCGRLLRIVGCKSYRITFRTKIGIKSDLRIFIKNSLKLINVSNPGRRDFQTYFCHILPLSNHYN